MEPFLDAIQELKQVMEEPFHLTRTQAFQRWKYRWLTTVNIEFLHYRDNKEPLPAQIERKFKEMQPMVFETLVKSSTDDLAENTPNYAKFDSRTLLSIMGFRNKARPGRGES